MQDDFNFCRPHLVNGEYILWQGKPEKGNVITSADIFLIPFSLLWCGFAFFWEIMVIANGAPFFFALFGLPFICIGLYLVVGRFFWTAYIRKRTAYVITNKKIIRLRGQKIDILDGKTLPSIQVVVYKNGNGTIQFGQEPFYYGRRYRRGFSNSEMGVFSLENIANVVQVQEIIGNMEG